MDQLQPPARWSVAVNEATWIAERLGPFGAAVTSVVPAGFAAYARVLHPAEDPRHGHRLVRWNEVAAWSGLPLHPDAQFHTVALPPTRPAAPAPWSGQGPHAGSLYPPDAEVLAEVLRGRTTTPEECFFAIWDGYGWGGTLLSTPGTPPVTLPDSVPAAARRGPRLRLPGRDYLLYTGPVEAITASVDIGDCQTANLAWPKDRAWCVASEIDLAWSYVAGSASLVGRLLDEPRIEALPAGPDDPLTRVEPFVASLVSRAVDELLANGHAVISTSRGTVDVSLERPTRWRAGALRVRTKRDDTSSGEGWSSGGLGPVKSREELRRGAERRLTMSVVELVGG